MRYRVLIAGIIALCAVIWLASPGRKPVTPYVSGIQPVRVNTPAANLESHKMPPASNRAEQKIAPAASKSPSGPAYKKEVSVALEPKKETAVTSKPKNEIVMASESKNETAATSGSKNDITAASELKPEPQPSDSLPPLTTDRINEEITPAKKEARVPERTEKPVRYKARTKDIRPGNAVNCKGYPLTCNWFDAMAYCGGLLPTVAQLKSIYQAECTEGREAETCNKWYWSSEEEGPDTAWIMAFYTGNVSSENKNYAGNAARCER